jgi:hypothetical protein
MPGLSTWDVGGCCCTIIVRAIGCSVLGVPGLTITIYEADGVTVHDSQVSDGSGNVTFGGVSGTRRITVTGDTWFAAYDNFVALSALTVVSLSPATGYNCGCNCPNAFPNTLHITPTLGGSTGTLLWTGSLWDSRGVGSTGFTLTTACLLSIYISGVLCQNLTPFSKVCNPINIVYHTFFQNAIPCSFAAGTAYTVTA